jgi:hypothetical protein
VGLLDRRRERQAELASQRAQRESEQQHAVAAEVAQRHQYAVELLEWMVADSQGNPGGDVAGFEERRNERTFAVLEGVALIEPRRQAGTYQGRTSGYSFRIAKGVNYRIGATKGTFVPGPDVPTPIDTGTAFVTNQRVVFRGDKATREWAWAKLISLDHDDDLPWTSLPVSNRQKTSGLLYDVANMPIVRYRLQQGLAHFQGKVDLLTADLERQLVNLRRGSVPDG